MNHRGLHRRDRGARSRASCHVPAATAQESGAKQDAGVKAIYYVDFRARTPATYAMRLSGSGAWTASKSKLRACIQPRTARFPTSSVNLPGAVQETGKSYGDLDEAYLTGATAS